MTSIDTDLIARLDAMNPRQLLDEIIGITADIVKFKTDTSFGEEQDPHLAEARAALALCKSSFTRMWWPFPCPCKDGCATCVSQESFPPVRHVEDIADDEEAARDLIETLRTPPQCKCSVCRINSRDGGYRKCYECEIGICPACHPKPSLEDDGDPYVDAWYDDPSYEEYWGGEEHEESPLPVSQKSLRNEIATLDHELFDVRTAGRGSQREKEILARLQLLGASLPE